VPASARTAGPPWCAWFVSACSAIAEQSGHTIWRPVPSHRGRAVAPWIDAPAERRIAREDVWTQAKPGDVMCRTRVSGPVTDRAKVLAGIPRDGHTGIVERVDRAARTVHLVCGNSSGHGHARTTGAVAREVIREGDAAWHRLAGFVRVAGAI
jgi:hypothetical protein